MITSDRKGEGKVVESSILVFANNAVANTFVLGGVSSFIGADHPCKKYTWCHNITARVRTPPQTRPIPFSSHPVSNSHFLPLLSPWALLTVHAGSPFAWLSYTAYTLLVHPFVSLQPYCCLGLLNRSVSPRPSRTRAIVFRAPRSVSSPLAACAPLVGTVLTRGAPPRVICTGFDPNARVLLRGGAPFTPVPAPCGPCGPCGP
eukprot:1194651-Prorocentrum_minimum.AAC.4